MENPPFPCLPNGPDRQYRGYDTAVAQGDYDQINKIVDAGITGVTQTLDTFNYRLLHPAETRFGNLPHGTHEMPVRNLQLSTSPGPGVYPAEAPSIPEDRYGVSHWEKVWGKIPGLDVECMRNYGEGTGKRIGEVLNRFRGEEARSLHTIDGARLGWFRGKDQPFSLNEKSDPLAQRHLTKLALREVAPERQRECAQKIVDVFMQRTEGKLGETTTTIEEAFSREDLAKLEIAFEPLCENKPSMVAFIRYCWMERVFELAAHTINERLNANPPSQLQGAKFTVRAHPTKETPTATYSLSLTAKRVESST